MTTETQELKACPFCGSDAGTRVYHDESLWSHDIVPHLQISCGECGVSMDSEEHDQVRTAWNTRPREEALEAEVTALRAQVRTASEAAQVVWSGEHARLEAALRPFLALARAVTVDGSPDFVHWAREAKDWTVAFSFAGHSISLGDLRTLAALSHPKGADDEQS